MAKECCFNFFSCNTAAVVSDTNISFSAVFDLDYDGIRTGVNRVFHQFLDDGNRSFDDLSCGNFISDILF